MTDPKKPVHVIVLDGLADWEPANALAEARRSGGYPVLTVGFRSAPVVSMGGLTILPDRSIDDVAPGDASLWLVPGSDAWYGDVPQVKLTALLQAAIAAGIPIAGICAGTRALAQAGVLKGRRHTSNSPKELAEFAPMLLDTADYVDVPAVRDRSVITAAGIGFAEFACEVWKELAVMPDAVADDFLAAMKAGRLPEEMR